MNGPISRFIGRAILKLGGWKIVGVAPDLNKYVLVAAPHTSNWDFVWVMSIVAALGVRLSWLGKEAMFKPPFGVLFRMLGGLPVIRSARSDQVAQIVERFRETESLVLLLSVEGTRGYAPHWKSGFYHMALAAGVPLVLGQLDYENRTGGFGLTLPLTGNVTEDMDKIRAFYADAHGKHPENAGPMQLKEELETAEVS